MSKTALKRSVFSAVTAACLVSGFALTGLAPASASTPSIDAVVSATPGTKEGSKAGSAEDLLPNSALASGEDMTKFWEENQAPLGDATALIEGQFPGEFAYGFFDDDSAMHVGFKGAAPAEAVALLEGTGLPYVVIESVGFNAADYQVAAEDLADQLRTYVTDDRQVSVSQNSAIAPGALKVSFQSEDPALTTDPGIAEPAANARSSESVQPVDVDTPFTVVFDDSHTSPAEFAGYGRSAGMWLLDSTGTGVCTVGFVVKSTSDSSLGVLSAAHCPRNPRYYNPATGDVVQLEQRPQVIDDRGEVQWHRSPVMMDAWFHTSATSGQPVKAVRNPYANEYVKSYGRQTNVERTGQVYEVNTIVDKKDFGYFTRVGNQVQVLVPMVKGDSGAPLYGGNTAMGILSSTSLNGVLANYTRITSAQSALGVKVCIDPVCS